MKVTIIGAGIGGLTLAIALQQKGIAVEIFEAASNFGKVGAGIMIANNAVQVFKRLNIADQVQAAGQKISKMQITTHHGKVLSAFSMKEYEQRFGVYNTAIHRATLHQVLLKNLNGVPIHTNKKLSKLIQKDGIVELLFEDGTSIESNLVVGADGVHSVVRKNIFSNTKERSAKQICWRGITPMNLPSEHEGLLREVWAPGTRFGFVQVSDKQTYWFACASIKNSMKEYDNKDWKSLFDNYSPLVQKLITSTPNEVVLTNEIIDLVPIDTFYKGNVCLMGDAAHATTPNMGQGACQAIESAWVLADRLSHEKNIQKALEQYQAIRKPKAQQIVNRSWQFGKMAQWSNPVLCSLRNFLVQMTPDLITQKQMQQIYELNY